MMSDSISSFCLWCELFCFHHDKLALFQIHSTFYFYISVRTLLLEIEASHLSLPAAHVRKLLCIKIQIPEMSSLASHYTFLSKSSFHIYFEQTSRRTQNFTKKLLTEYSCNFYLWKLVAGMRSRKFRKQFLEPYSHCRHIVTRQQWRDPLVWTLTLFVGLTYP